MLAVAEREQLPVAAARAGSPSAWDALFRRYQLPLCAYVFELVRNERRALDLVQETFIKATRHLALLVFNYSQSESRLSAAASAITTPSAIRFALQEQKQVLDEIMGPCLVSPPAESPRRLNNQPRSEYRSVDVVHLGQLS